MNTDTASAVAEQLQALQAGTEWTNLSLRIDHENAETVYLEADGASVVVHDRGETFYYLAVEGPATGDDTFAPWSAADAQRAAGAHDVTLEDTSDDDGEGFRLVLHVPAHGRVHDAIDRVAAAVDSVLRAHQR